MSLAKLCRRRDASPLLVRFKEGSIYNDAPLPFRRWAERILADRPDIVGFTTYMTSFASALQLARAMRELSPLKVAVFGGPKTAQDREGDFALRTGIPDLVVHGEGETVIVDIAEAVANGGVLGERCLVGEAAGMVLPPRRGNVEALGQHGQEDA